MFESARKSFVVHRQLQSAKKVTFPRPLLFLFFIHSYWWRILNVSCNLNNIRGNEGNGSCGERPRCECRLDDLFVDKQPCSFSFPKTKFFVSYFLSVIRQKSLVDLDSWWSQWSWFLADDDPLLPETPPPRPPSTIKNNFVLLFFCPLYQPVHFLTGRNIARIVFAISKSFWFTWLSLWWPIFLFPSPSVRFLESRNEEGEEFRLVFRAVSGDIDSARCFCHFSLTTAAHLHYFRGFSFCSIAPLKRNTPFMYWLAGRM